MRDILHAIRTQEQLLEEAHAVLKTIVNDCVLALTDEWDRSDEGFVAIQLNCQEWIDKHDAAKGGEE